MGDLAPVRAPEPSVKRDRWGRYLLPHPDTGVETAFTRVTTLAGSITDRFNLERWGQRMVALGLAHRHDLYARIAACDPDDKKTLDRLVGEAKDATAAGAGANLGTALHQFTEAADRGQEVHPPPPWDADLAAYRQTLDRYGIRVVDGWVERIVIATELDVAGTLDRLVQVEGRVLPMIADLKTGRHLSFPEIAVQLACYAHAGHVYHPDLGVVRPMPPVDRTRGLVIHLPAGTATATCYLVDLEAGWAAARLAAQVRAWRKADQLVEPFTGAGTPADSPAAPDLIDWLRHRARVVIDAGGGPTLAAAWPDDTPTLKGNGHTAGHVSDIDAALCDVERQLGLPFPSDPSTNQPTNQPEREF